MKSLVLYIYPSKCDSCEDCRLRLGGVSGKITSTRIFILRSEWYTLRWVNHLDWEASSEKLGWTQLQLFKLCCPLHFTCSCPREVSERQDISESTSLLEKNTLKEEISGWLLLHAAWMTEEAAATTKLPMPRKFLMPNKVSLKSTFLQRN